MTSKEETMESAKQTVFTEPEYLLHRLDYPKATEAEKLELVEAFRNAIIAATEAKVREEYAVVSEVVAERVRQDGKWGGPEHDDQHSTADFVQFIEDWAGWARAMAGMNSHDKARRRLIQVAALAVAAVESIDRKAALEGKVSQ
jgi:hypothetical protein